MNIGIPTEVKNEERRVAATPETVRKMTNLGLQVVIQKGAGERANISDEAYQAAGAKLVLAQEVFEAAIILKVRTPEPIEIEAMNSGTVLIGMLDPYNQAINESMGSESMGSVSIDFSDPIDSLLMVSFCVPASNASSGTMVSGNAVPTAANIAAMEQQYG